MHYSAMPHLQVVMKFVPGFSSVLCAHSFTSAAFDMSVIHAEDTEKVCSVNRLQCGVQFCC